MGRSKKRVDDGLAPPTTCCCCCPSCTVWSFVRSLLLVVLLSVALAYAIKAVWVRAEWERDHPAPPPGNTTASAHFTWSMALQHHSFWAWDAQYYVPALVVASIVSAIMVAIIWYTGNKCVSCVRRRCCCCARAPPTTYSKLEKHQRKAMERELRSGVPLDDVVERHATSGHLLERDVERGTHSSLLSDFDREVLSDASDASDAEGGAPRSVALLAYREGERLDKKRKAKKQRKAKKKSK